MSIVLSPILHQYNDYTLTFDCPGCKIGHVVYLNHPGNIHHPGWGWNNDVNNPTFSPSLLVEFPWWNGEAYDQKRCHSFIRDGQIQFLSDCTHELANQTVPLPVID
jgi:hypothetical protein